MIILPLRCFALYSRFVGFMEKHGFVVLTDIGAVRGAYLEFIQVLKAFFDTPSTSKEACKGAVYFNERGIPMVSVFPLEKNPEPHGARREEAEITPDHVAETLERNCPRDRQPAPPAPSDSNGRARPLRVTFLITPPATPSPGTDHSFPSLVSV